MCQTTNNTAIGDHGKSIWTVRANRPEEDVSTCGGSNTVRCDQWTSVFELCSSMRAEPSASHQGHRSQLYNFTLTPYVIVRLIVWTIWTEPFNRMSFSRSLKLRVNCYSISSKGWKLHAQLLSNLIVLVIYCIFFFLGSCNGYRYDLSLLHWVSSHQTYHTTFLPWMYDSVYNVSLYNWWGSNFIVKANVKQIV